MTMFVYNFQVQETHLDTFGHMNHATYLVIYEQARWEWITEGGFGLDRIHKEQMGPTILEAKVTYRRELKLRANIRVETEVADWDGKVGKVKQRMLNEAGKVCSEAELTVGFFDMKERKLINAPEAWQKAIEAQNA